MQKDLKEVLVEAGIVGAGGAGFPTHVKLAENMQYIVVNGAECEPLLYTDEQLLTHKGEEIIDTLEEMLEAMAIPQGIIAIKKKYPKLVETLATYAQRYPRITIKAVIVFIPSGMK